MERRPHRPGGYFRSMLRREKYRMAAETANEELNLFKIGEPSEAFFPSLEEKDETVIYLADKVKQREEKLSRERETIASSQDIERRRIEQFERYVWDEHIAGHRGNLTMASRRFGLRHRIEIEALR